MVIDLAHKFGKVAVAIGIEKAADAVALGSMGRNFGQGFPRPPMPEERFTSLLRQRASTKSTMLASAADQSPRLTRQWQSAGAALAARGN